MNKIVIAALAACLATSVSAREQDITVTASPTFDEWVTTVSQSLEKSLNHTKLDRSESGITYVRFTCGADGRPQNVATASRSASKRNLARAGRAAVRRIPSLHPLFSEAQPGQLYEAAIVVAHNQDQLELLTAKATQRAQRQNAQWAARDVPNAVISLAVVGGF